MPAPWRSRSKKRTAASLWRAHRNSAEGSEEEAQSCLGCNPAAKLELELAACSERLEGSIPAANLREFVARKQELQRRIGCAG